ncbi:PID-CTERM protein-sorting domain-containing protein [Hymenobacter convexus]|uniref:PID-CTERM protein-sorting domain-containing protein n=1 Tax=Hymenobacter sp. CA1UV-4 TaxID=3063782 RepID=UPI0027140E5E|nr:hypothetical protein [Hymenobacter sp. CA1UV-4]MDO7849975.1 hypothetical protein [Hymenobacter sp. CA1UV-4]
MLIAGLLLGGATLQAVQAQPSSGGPGPGTPPAITDAPLDGGASLLLASGVGYGLARLRRVRGLKKAAGV